MRLVLIAALIAVAGCDSPTEPRGAFSVTLSGARTDRLDGAAEFERSPCRSFDLRSGSASLSLRTACSGLDAQDAFRTGSLRVSSVATDSTVRVSFYDGADRRAYHGTGGAVEITAESPERVTGRFDVEAHRLRFDNTVDTTGTPLRLVGTFDAVAFVRPKPD